MIEISNELGDGMSGCRSLLPLSQAFLLLLALFLAADLKYPVVQGGAARLCRTALASSTMGCAIPDLSIPALWRKQPSSMTTSAGSLQSILLKNLWSCHRH